MPDTPLNRTVLIVFRCMVSGGTEYQTLHLVKVLTGAGYRVVAVCLFEYEEEIVSLFQKQGAEVVLFSPGQCGLPHGGSLVSFLFRHFRKILKKYRPRVVHVQLLAPGSPKEPGTLAVFLLRALGVKNLVVTSHAGYIQRERVWVSRLMACGVTRAFLCVSRTMQEAMFGKSLLFSSDMFRKGGKVFTIYNCVDVSELPAEGLKSKGVRMATDPVRIGMIGRLVYRKGTDVLLRALAPVAAKGKNLRLFVAGEGPERERLVQLAGELSLSGHVEWLGKLSRDKVFALYAQLDMAVMPSRSEGLPLTALEAMASGVPLIASGTGEVRELVDHGVNGFIVDPEDVEGFSAMILKLADDPELRKRMGEAGRKKVAETFGWDVYREKILSLYGMLLEERNR